MRATRRLELGSPSVPDMPLPASRNEPLSHIVIDTTKSLPL